MRALVKKLLDLEMIEAKRVDDLITEFEEEIRLGRGSNIHSILRESEGCDDEELSRVWADWMDWPNVTGPGEVHPGYIREFGIEFSRQHRCVVLEEKERLLFACAHPFNRNIGDEVSLQLKSSLVSAIISEQELNRLLEKSFNFTTEDNTFEELDAQNIKKLQQEISRSDDLLDMANKAPVVKLVNGILFQALKQRSSDIHVQPREGDFVVRYRIDGLLQDVMTLPKSIQDAFLSRLKVMGKMDIAERRLPQDGTTSFVSAGREVDVRISSLPSIHGERIVMRLQDQSSGVKALSEIGLLPPHLKNMDRLLKMSHGIILVTGPTGAGKTTTLYGMLNELNQPDINIITLEDPVELSLAGVSQIQVAHKKGLSFAKGLRSIVRQDPDVIMVGEIRDLETARISIQSALTGHLVLSTLHTNDAISAITRLIDIGVEPSMINASVLGVIAQRLVRTLCPSCKTPIRRTEDQLLALSFSPKDFDGATLYEPVGCDECQHSGYNGRTALYEFFLLTQAVKNELHGEGSYPSIVDAAHKSGFKSLREDGIEKVKLGHTTPEEVFRVTQVSGY
jgi:general secretion pathway protein E